LVIIVNVEKNIKGVLNHLAYSRGRFPTSRSLKSILFFLYRRYVDQLLLAWGSLWDSWPQPWLYSYIQAWPLFCSSLSSYKNYPVGRSRARIWKLKQPSF